MAEEFAVYTGLFVSAFLAATLIPGSSEAALAGALLLFPGSVVALVTVATAGNTAGAVLNWFLGRFFIDLVGKRWFPVTARRLEQAAGLFNRYGSWPLLFSWLPLVGDPMTVAAGALRVRLLVFLPLVLIGKAARYAVVAAAMAPAG